MSHCIRKLLLLEKTCLVATTWEKAEVNGWKKPVKWRMKSRKLALSWVLESEWPYPCMRGPGSADPLKRCKDRIFKIKAKHHLHWHWWQQVEMGMTKMFGSVFHNQTLGFFQFSFSRLGEVNVLQSKCFIWKKGPDLVTGFMGADLGQHWNLTLSMAFWQKA